MENSRFIGIDPQIARQVRDRFIRYASSFRKDHDTGYNQHMELKQHHTGRVVEEILQLGGSLNMQEKHLAFVEVIAWLHDIGRFEQFDKYGTFSDAESENHAELALRVIEENRILPEMADEEMEVIQGSILNHNIPAIPDGQPPRVELYSKILRDADKLDIWRVAIEVNIFHRIRSETLPATYAVPEELFQYFTEGRTIPLAAVNSFYDSILFRLSWIYDLNFPHTLRAFRERNLGERFLAKIPTSEKLMQIAEMMAHYRMPSPSVTE